MQRYCLFSWYTTILRGISCRWWIFFEKKDGFVLPYQKKVVILQYQNALWCNGSTPDSGSVCEGSSPSKATKSKSSLWWFALFLFVPARNRSDQLCPEICCKFCKMCVKLKSFVVKNDTIFARNYWRRFLF